MGQSHFEYKTFIDSLEVHLETNLQKRCKLPGYDSLFQHTFQNHFLLFWVVPCPKDFLNTLPLAKLEPSPEREHPVAQTDSDGLGTQSQYQTLLALPGGLQEDVPTVTRTCSRAVGHFLHPLPGLLPDGLSESEATSSGVEAGIVIHV